jgi:ligand-binding sensor protein
MGIVIGYNQSFKTENKQVTKLTDIVPVEQWKELEKQIHERSGLNAYVYNTEGRSITDFKRWANRLCPAIKATDKGLAFICAAANQNLANEAFRKKGPVIGECDAGLLKVAVPIFVGDLFLGVVGGCGHIIDHSEVESFLVHKIVGIDEDTIAALSSGIHRKTADEVERLVEFIQGQVDRIVRAFEKAGTKRHVPLVL